MWGELVALSTLVRICFVFLGEAVQVVGVILGSLRSFRLRH